MPAAPSIFVSPRFALAVQCAVLAGVVAVAELAPRPGLAALYVPFVPGSPRAALDWALENGAKLNGAGPFGGLILISPPPGLGMRAMREGALAVAIPSFLCQPPKASPHG
ncbi:hypothetical protein [Novosphingobium sp.]|uniref:hypothetical protein n=1 Tax=Novosphingobium sp. TaxID=1874826 RepID=UPI002629CA7D|nr:hypothetical protein [Novosphingobium sp.]